MKNIILLLGFGYIMFCTALPVAAQSVKDTVLIDGSNINTKLLRPGTNRYLVYMQMGIDSPMTAIQLWTNSIEHIDYNGKKAIQVNYEWKDKDTVFHKFKSVCDRKTFQPLYQDQWSKPHPGLTFDFMKQSAILAGASLSDADTLPWRKGPWDAFKKAMDQYSVFWNNDLEIFPLLPYKEGKTFLIPFYQPGSYAPKNEIYAVKGSVILESYDKKEIDCWLLEHETKMKTRSGDWNSVETYWISKKGREVLKMKQVINGKQYRYKLKLPFSM